MLREKTDLIVIHTSATPQDMDIGAAEIDQWHKERGWTEIGYHYVIRRNGEIEKGRDINDVGAHAKGYNRVSVAVCMVGGNDAENRTIAECNYTRAQWASLESLVKRLKTAWPLAYVIGHRDLPGVSKACPVFDAGAWWGKS